MKKHIVPITIISIVIVFFAGTVLLYSLPSKVILEIECVDIKEKIIDDYAKLVSLSSSYDADINEIEKRVEKVKVVEIQCAFKNIGLKKIIIPYVVFAKSQNLPSIILGKKLNRQYEGTVQLCFLEETHQTFEILVDASNHTDEEILQILENVNVCAIDYCKLSYNDCDIISEPVPIR